jgi:hypothetical protein
MDNVTEIRALSALNNVCSPLCGEISIRRIMLRVGRPLISGDFFLI